MHFFKTTKRKLKKAFKLVKLQPEFQSEFKIFQRTNGDRFNVNKKDLMPCLVDKFTRTSFDKHYTYHTAWAARTVAKINPIEHTDISSLTYFSTLISAFIPVHFYDYRPEPIVLENLSCHHCDIVNLKFDDEAIHSLSCMHVVEHIGLGRYGDPIDVDGDLRAIKELIRVLAKGGHLLFVVPIGGTPKIAFNAHRIYSYSQIISYFSSLSLVEFSLIPDKSDEGIIFNATPEQAAKQQYGCGCFWFKK